MVIPIAAHPGVLQVASSSTPSQGTCFGYNNNQVNDSLIPPIVRSLRIAVVQPLFTSTPYSQYATGSFYAFYGKYQSVNANVTSNLDWLSTNVASGYSFKQGWGLSYSFYEFLTSQTAKNCGLEVGANLRILSDINVSQGALFDRGNQGARFDVVVLPFSEYVTSQEYLAYEDFVAEGGTLITMAHSLEYPVTYDAATNLETLVYGHGWAFNGKYAYPIPCASDVYVYTCPWARNNTDWMGSNTCMSSCFHVYKYNGSVVNREDGIGEALYNEFGDKVFRSYNSHEENTVTNRTGTSISSVFVNDTQNLIASYTHQFRKGFVVSMSVFGDDIIATDQSAQYFLLRGMTLHRTGPSVAVSSPPSVSTTTSSAESAGGGSSGSTAVTSVTTTPQSSEIVPGSLAIVGGVGAAVVILAGVAVLLRRQKRQGA